MAIENTNQTPQSTENLWQESNCERLSSDSENHDTRSMDYPPCLKIIQWQSENRPPTPTDILQKLYDVQKPDHSRYGPSQRTHEWVFRGMQSADWRLLPTSRREKCETYPFTGLLSSIMTSYHNERSIFWNSDDSQPGMIKKLNDFLEHYQETDIHHFFEAAFNNLDGHVKDRFRTMHLATEFQAVRDFAEIANDAGLIVLDNLDDITEGLAALLAGEEDWRPCMTTALAQHHGVPTKLLDWTRRTKIAAYFAALPPEGKNDKEGNMAVWALNAGSLPNHSLRNTSEQSLVHVLRCNHAQHPFLHAQDGLFTWINESFQRQWIHQHNEWPSILEALAHDGFEYPVAFKIVFPRSVAKELRTHLRAERVSHATMMPTYDSVGKSLHAIWADRI